MYRIIDSPYELVVQRVNPVEAGMHMRLLVRLTGQLAAPAVAWEAWGLLATTGLPLRRGLAIIWAGAMSRSRVACW